MRDRSDSGDNYNPSDDEPETQYHCVFADHDGTLTPVGGRELILTDAYRSVMTNDEIEVEIKNELEQINIGRAAKEKPAISDEGLIYNVVNKHQLSSEQSEARTQEILAKMKAYEIEHPNTFSMSNGAVDFIRKVLAR